MAVSLSAGQPFWQIPARQAINAARSHPTQWHSLAVLTACTRRSRPRSTADIDTGLSLFPVWYATSMHHCCSTSRVASKHHGQRRASAAQLHGAAVHAKRCCRGYARESPGDRAKLSSSRLSRLLNQACCTAAKVCKRFTSLYTYAQHATMRPCRLECDGIAPLFGLHAQHSRAYHLVDYALMRMLKTGRRRSSEACRSLAATRLGYSGCTSLRAAREYFAGTSSYWTNPTALHGCTH